MSGCCDPSGYLHLFQLQGRPGVDFQSYIHDPDAIVETTRAAGFDHTFHFTNLIWHGTVFTRR